MLSVRITAAGAVVAACLCYSTAPVSACDERYVKNCEKISAAAAAREETQAGAPVSRRKAAGRVHVVFSRRSKNGRLVRRTRAPGFSVAKRERGMTLASDSTRMTALVPESALARRFRGFIDPLPMAQNAFETLRKPHLVALNLDAAPALAVAEAVPTPSGRPDTAEPATASIAPPIAKQDRIAAKPAVSEPAVTKPVALTEALAANPLVVAQGKVTPAPLAQAGVVEPAAQAVVSASPPAAPADEQPGRFSIHQLVLALCGALGAASALRFIVGA